MDKLVYLDAFLPQDGDSAFSVVEKLNRQSEQLSGLATDTAAPERFIFSDDKKTFKWNPEHVQHYFYHHCTEHDLAFAKALLCWQSVATLATPIRVTDEVYGRIKKYYILCNRARDLHNKISLTYDIHCEKIYELSSSHSPFLSIPEELANILSNLC